VGKTRYLVNGKFVEDKTLPGLLVNTGDPVIRKALSSYEEQVMENGIVVHALPRLMQSILGHFSKEGIKPARTERIG